MARKRTGCRNCMIAIQIKDKQTGKITFGKPEPLENLEQINYNYTYAEGSNYADNVQNIYKKKPTGADITLGFSDVSLAQEAKLMGKKYKSGAAATNTNDKNLAVALLFQETFNDGSYQNVVFYNATLNKDSQDNTSETDNIDFSPVNFSGKSIPFFNDDIKGDIDLKVDSSEAEGTLLTAFFTEVQHLEITSA